MNVASVTAIVVAIISVVGILIYGLGGKSRENTNEAIMQENISLRNQLGDEKVANASLTTRVEKSEKNEDYLKSIVQSKPDFELLSVQLTKQHKEIIGALTGLTKAITQGKSNG